MEFRVIIPARYESKRFLGKVLADIAGKPMIQHVYQRALESGAESVVIATDSDQIREVSESFGANVCMTGSDHESGTARLAEAVATLEYDADDIVVNLQGDEPFLYPGIIRQVASDLDQHDNVKVSTICEPITEVEDLLDPNVVKVVMNKRNYAMYFSRAAIPYERDSFSKKENISLKGKHYGHAGLFAYRVGFLQDYIALPVCSIEGIEKLEQLRMLWHGIRIYVGVTEKKLPPSVDSKEDLEKAIAYFSGKGK